MSLNQILLFSTVFFVFSTFCFLIFIVIVIKEYKITKAGIGEFVKVINGNIKGGKLSLWRRLEIRGEYKGRELFCYSFGDDVDLWLIIDTKPKNAQVRKKPIFSFSKRQKRISRNIVLNTFSGYLSSHIILDRYFNQGFLRILDELVVVADKIESLDWEQVIDSNIKI